MRRRTAAAAVLGTCLVAGVVAAGCSDDDDGGGGAPGAASVSSAAATDSPAGTPGTPGTTARSLRVELIEPAVAALEEELGGPQEYFEINATPSLVNLFLPPLEAGGPVRAYAYVGGRLRLEEMPTGTGNTFRAAAIDIDPARVTARVGEELPTSTQDVFVIEGGPGGTVRYTIVLTSAVGGQLVVEVSGTGDIVSVDAV